MKKNIVKNLLLSLISFWGLFGSFSYSLAQTATPGTITFTNPLTYTTVDGVLGSFLNHMQASIVVIAMVFLVLGGLLYIFSTGNESRMKTAKAAIAAALIGLAIAIAAPSFVREIYTVLGSPPPGMTATAPTLATIALNTLNFLLSVVGTAAIIMLVAAGIAYMTASGNEGQIETAKKMTKWAIVGIAVALGALVLVKQVASFFT